MNESEVLEAASYAYYIAKLRNHREKHSSGDVCYDNLSEMFPDHYSRVNSLGHYAYEGPTADEIIDEWVIGQGHPQGSEKWSRMIRLAVSEGEKMFRISLDG